MSFSSLSRKGFSILWALISLAAVLLATGLFLAGPAAAATGLTVEVTRNGNLLMAEATTVEGSEVDDNSWRWVMSEDCAVETFEDGEAGGEGWTVELDSESGGKHYCFYVEDSDGRQAVGGAEAVRPVVRVEQSNDQLVARVVNAEEENILVDENSWEWFRYNLVTDSRFGCESQHFGLDEEALRAAATTAEERQQAEFGEVRFEVYDAQKDVYLSGQGSTVSLTADDEGLNYCFRVADTAGIVNSWHMEVGRVIVQQPEAKDDSSLGSDGESVGSDEDAGEDGSGQVGLSPETSDDEAQPADDGGSNWVRNIGFALLAAAVIVGAVMLIRGSQLKDEEKEE